MKKGVYLKGNKGACSVYPVINRSFTYDQHYNEQGRLETYNFRPYNYTTYQVYFQDKLHSFMSIKSLNKFLSTNTGTTFNETLLKG